MNCILILGMFSPMLKYRIANFTNGEKCIAGSFDYETMKRAYFCVNNDLLREDNHITRNLHLKYRIMQT